MTALGSKAPLTIQRLLSFRRIGSFSVAPDGQTVVAVVNSTELDNNKERTQLWLFPRDGEARPLTSAEFSAQQPQFSPDGKWIAFLSKRAQDRQAQVYLLPLEGGEVQRLTNLPTGASAIKWSANGKRLAFVTSIWRDLDWAEQQKRIDEQASGSKTSARVYDHAPVTDWDNFLDDRERHVFVYDREMRAILPATSRTPLQLPRWTGGPLGYEDYDMSPDGEQIAFIADGGPNQGMSAQKVWLLTVGSQTPLLISEESHSCDITPVFSPDGRSLAMLRAPATRLWAEYRTIVIKSLDTHVSQVLCPDWDRSPRRLRWHPDGQSLLCLIEDEGLDKLSQVPLAGTWRYLTHQRSILDFGVVAAESNIIAIESGFTCVPRLVTLNPERGEVKSLSHFNEELEQSTAWGHYEAISYQGYANREIHMWVNYPPDFDPTRKYPLLLMIHGGPFAQAADRMSILLPMQVYAAQGFVVAYHNFHGSTGFGSAFTKSIQQDWATRPYTDTIKAAEWFTAQPWIDSERMIAAGGSYGGYLTCILQGRDHPFAALINLAGIYNLYSQYGSDYAFRQPVYEDYWSDPEAFGQHSPHVAVKNFKTPMLIGHGQLDQRVPINQAIELFHVLQRQGVPSRLVYYPDENHWFLKPQNALHWNEEMIAWMRRYGLPPVGSLNSTIE